MKTLLIVIAALFVMVGLAMFHDDPVQKPEPLPATAKAATFNKSYCDEINDKVWRETLSASVKDVSDGTAINAQDQVAYNDCKLAGYR